MFNSCGLCVLEWIHENSCNILLYLYVGYAAGIACSWLICFTYVHKIDRGKIYFQQTLTKNNSTGPMLVLLPSKIKKLCISILCEH